MDIETSFSLVYKVDAHSHHLFIVNVTNGNVVNIVDEENTKHDLLELAELNAVHPFVEPSRADVEGVGHLVRYPDRVLRVPLSVIFPRPTRTRNNINPRQQAPAQRHNSSEKTYTVVYKRRGTLYIVNIERGKVDSITTNTGGSVSLSDFLSGGANDVFKEATPEDVESVRRYAKHDVKSQPFHDFYFIQQNKKPVQRDEPYTVVYKSVEGGVRNYYTVNVKRRVVESVFDNSGRPITFEDLRRTDDLHTLVEPTSHDFRTEFDFNYATYNISYVTFSILYSTLVGVLNARSRGPIEYMVYVYDDALVDEITFTDEDDYIPDVETVQRFLVTKVRDGELVSAKDPYDYKHVAANAFKDMYRGITVRDATRDEIKLLVQQKHLDLDKYKVADQNVPFAVLVGRNGQ